MKKRIINTTLLASLFCVSTACQTKSEEQDSHAHAHDNHVQEVKLSAQQVQGLEVETGMMSKRNMASYVQANGQLEVPPQNEASVTAIIGANITEIKVIEGDKINKNQVLAYLSHPNLITIQTDYINYYSQLEYAEKDFERQEKLYEEKVSSGRDFQKVKANYLTVKGKVKGIESQLKLMGLDIAKIREGYVYERVPVKSPIDGFIRNVEVKTGQYVDPQQEMFEVVNNDHVHADFMVFEKDVHKVEEGQKVIFTVSSMPDKELVARIHSVGRAFESGPKAIHLHAEIENKEGYLIPGMYIKGKILTSEEENWALPEEAVVREGDDFYFFLAETDGNDWIFTPVKTKVGVTNDGWIEIMPLTEFKDTERFALSHAYTLMAEMKKEETEHSH